MKSRSDFWTASKIEALLGLYGKGLTAREIAQKLGAPSKNSVIGMANRLKKPHPPADKNAPPAHSPFKTLLSIARNECRWPVEDNLFCASITKEGDVYCETHKEKARRKPKMPD